MTTKLLRQQISDRSTPPADTISFPDYYNDDEQYYGLLQWVP